jgi:hypothetical protein
LGPEELFDSAVVASLLEELSGAGDIISPLEGLLGRECHRLAAGLL